MHAFGKLHFVIVTIHHHLTVLQYVLFQLSTMVNAFANMDSHHYHHQYPTLFERVAIAAIPILGTFQS
jgi:hypothetical protein